MMRPPAHAALLVIAAAATGSAAGVAQYSVFEASFEARTQHANPYTAIRAEAMIRRPDGVFWTAPLFWDGAGVWKLRISPDRPGAWSFRVSSNDAGLNGKAGAFHCVASAKPGGVRVSRNWPSHFERQNGEPFWFLGDTAWGYFTDSPEDKHHRPQAEQYARARASQGFNVIHSMLMSEQGVGNQNGPPFEEIAAEKINPAYWREVDERLAFANQQGLTVGLVLAWGDKHKREPFAWRMLPNVEARKRYARYIAARYAAYDVYFLVAGEWHAEVRTRDGVTEDEIFREFVEIGEEVRKADPHGRMIGIHPMTGHGSVREFASAPWMSFADYQQNYRNLHARALVSRSLRGPVVNSEYAYFLRDHKENSCTIEDIRHASWDIVMAGAYFVTGFGTTYFGGHRDPGPFDVTAAKNKDWELQAGLIRKFFEGLEWWRLVPADEFLSADTPRGGDRLGKDPASGRNTIQPPAVTYWALADPGQTYVLYARGVKGSLRFETGARTRTYEIWRFDPRTGEMKRLGEKEIGSSYAFTPPDERDWVEVLKAKAY
ncbi:MAG: apiosidase-like domain-containing protein [Bryobacteraceae bacterium]